MQKLVFKWIPVLDKSFPVQLFFCWQLFHLKKKIKRQYTESSFISSFPPKQQSAAISRMLEVVSVLHCEGPPPPQLQRYQHPHRTKIPPITNS